MKNSQRLVRERYVCAGVLCAALLLSSVACAGLESSAPPEVDIAGVWVLDPELTHAQMAERGAVMHRNVDGTGGAGSAGTMRIERHGAAGAGQAEMARRLESPEQIEIEHGEESMTLRTEASSETCGTTEQTQVSTPGGGIADRRCGWDGDEFVIELESPDGFTRRDSYALSDDGAQLIVTTKLEGKRMPGSAMTIRRVYDRAPAG